MATHNDVRRAALDKKRKATESAEPATPKKARKENTLKLRLTTKKQPVPTKNPKRKRNDDAVESPRKKANVSNDDAAARVRQKYQEPAGIRKSGRIAGRPATGSGSPPVGQYVQEVDDTDGVNPSPNLQSDQGGNIDPQLSGDPHTTNAPNDQNSNGTEDASPQFAKVVCDNIGSHRIVRTMTKEYAKWTQRLNDLTHREGGLEDLETQLRRMKRDVEQSEEDIQVVRDRHAKRLEQVNSAKHYVSALTVPMEIMNAKHFDRNSRIYEFIDIRRETAELQSLPANFWAAYDDCNAAHAACKEIETEIQNVDQEHDDILWKLDERMRLSVLRNGGASVGEADVEQAEAFQESAEEAFERIREVSSKSVKLNELNERLDAAKDARYDQESKLNKIAENAFVVAGRLVAVSDAEEIKLLRRLPATHISDEASARRGISRTEPVDQNSGSTALDHDKSALAGRVTRARRNVRECRRRLDNIRWGDLSDAGSIDSDAQGELRVRKMIERTGKLREAQDEYRSILHHAQDDRAISESDQSSNFRDHGSDGYGTSTLRRIGYPMKAKKKNRVHSWMGSTSRRKQKEQNRQDAQASSKERNWVDRVDSMAVGEDLCYIGIERLRDRIDNWDKERNRLRKEGPFKGAENDFHPQNDAAIVADFETEQFNDAISLEVGNDGNEDIPQSPSNPRVLYDLPSANLIDSDDRATQWIEEHFNGSWPMRDTEG